MLPIILATDQLIKVVGLIFFVISTTNIFATEHTANTSKTSLPNIQAINITSSIAIPDLVAITKEQVNAARSLAEADINLSDTDKSTALDFYDQTITGLKEAEALQNQIVALDTKIRDAPRRISEIRQLLNELQPSISESPAILPNVSLSQLELKINEQSLNLDQDKNSLHTYEDELSMLLVGTKSLTEYITERIQALEQLDKEIASQLTSNEPQSVRQAKVADLSVRRRVRTAEIDLLKKRLSSSMLTDLAQSERDLLVAKIAHEEQILTILKQQEQNLHESQAAAARVRAEAEVHKAHQAQLPLETQEIAADNAKLRQELEQLVVKEQQVNLQLQDAAQMLETLKGDFDRIRQRVDVAGPSRAIGRMLRQRRAALPSLSNYRRESRERAEQIGKATDRQMEIDDLLREAPLVAHIWNQTHRDSLNELQKVYSRYITSLASLDAAERQLVELAKAYIAYIDDQLIWIPSISLPSILSGDDVLTWDPWLSKLENWRLVTVDLISAMGYWLGRVLIILGILIAALLYKSQLNNRLNEISQVICKIRYDSFLLTLEALSITILLAMPIPIMVLATGLLLQYLPTAYPFTLAVGAGLYNTGLFLGSLWFLAVLCQNDGLGDRHLFWPAPIRKAVINKLRWFMPLGAVLSFLVAITAGPETPTLTQTVGILAFIMLMLSTGFILARLLGYSGAIKRAWLDHHRTHWINQLRFLWFPVIIGVPMMLAFMSITGYNYTAVYLEHYIQITVWYFFGLMLLRDLILRWLFVVERRLRYEKVLRRRAELRMQRRRSNESISKNEGSSIVLEIPEVDYGYLSEQSRSLVHAGFTFGVILGSWAIWNNLLPAMSGINSIELPLHITRIIDGVPKEVSVTLVDATMSAFVLMITALAAKNLPGVLEITLLQRLPLNPGMRYAVSTIAQYIITAIGIIITLSTLGMRWTSIKWLIAALGVGLGFGLQEIVANFISGIILLFEQPIRVGDVVTIDGTTGIISRIHIRATTITNYDKQELIVPNKDFITGKLVNWTLSDTVNRITVTIGIAYGSDVRNAIRLLTEISAENEHVLKDPKPLISFESFGDNAMIIKLRCYLENLDNRLATITALHMAINDQFAAAGINIAFPQLNVHLYQDNALISRK